MNNNTIEEVLVIVLVIDYSGRYHRVPYQYILYSGDQIGEEKKPMRTVLYAHWFVNLNPIRLIM